VAIAIALQLEAAWATTALSRFNYDTMPSFTSLNLSYYSVLLLIHYFMPWPWPLTLWLWPLTLNICSVSSVTWWNSMPNLNAIEQSATELLRLQC